MLAQYSVNIYSAGANVPTANTEAVEVYVPPAAAGNLTKRLVIALSGSGGSAATGGSGGYFGPILEYLASKGILCMSIDAGSNGTIVGGATNPDNWGNTVSTTAIDNAITWSTSGFDSNVGGTVSYASTTLTDSGKAWATNSLVGRTVWSGTKTLIVTSNTATVATGTAGWVGGTPSAAAQYYISNIYGELAPSGRPLSVILLGASMGGLKALNYAARNPTKVAAMVLIGGLYDLETYYAAASAGTQGTIDAAFAPVAAASAPTSSAGAGSAFFYAVAEIGAMGDGPISPISTGYASSTGTITLPAGAAASASAIARTGRRVIRATNAGFTTGVVDISGALAAGATTFSDTGIVGSAYTLTGAAGTATSAWRKNGLNVTPSYNPLTVLNAGGGTATALQAIPNQYWWSAYDTVVTNGTSVAGVEPTLTAAFITAYGGNAVAKEVPNDPTHPVESQGIYSVFAAPGATAVMVPTSAFPVNVPPPQSLVDLYTFVNTYV